MNGLVAYKLTLIPFSSPVCIHAASSDREHDSFEAADGQTYLPTQSTAMPSGEVMYLMSRSTEAPMLLLPSSTEGIYALLMAPAAESLAATVKYTMPEKSPNEMKEWSIPEGTVTSVFVGLRVWAVRLTETGVVVVPVVVQRHDVLLFLEEVVVGLSLQVEPPDTNVLW